MNEAFNRRQALGLLGAATAASLLPQAAFAQAYPNRPVRLLVGGSAGGPTDALARIYSDVAAPSLKEPVVVENRAGATGTIAAAALAKTGADGHLLMAASPATMLIAPHVFPKLEYDTERDFVPVTMLAGGGMVVAVHPSVPVNNLAELIAYAKARPRALNFGSGGPGSSSHVAAEAFMARAGIEMSHVPYKGDAQAALDLVGGQIQVMFPGPVLALPHMKNGRLKVLAVTSMDRLQAMPEVPPVHETLPGFEYVTWVMLFAHSAVPAADLDKLAAPWVQARQQAAIKAKLDTLGMVSLDRYATRASLTPLLKAEQVRMKQLVQKLNLTAT